MTFRIAIAALLAVMLTLCSASAHPAAGRKLQMSEEGTGRKLLDISVGNTNAFSLSAFGTKGQTPNGNCYLQGYPGGRADSTVAGPLKVSTYVGQSTTITFNRGSDTSISNYNYSGNVEVVQVNQNSSYGLGSIVFSPKSVGQSVNVLSGLVQSGDPITTPICLIQIIFTGTQAPAPPSPPPTPTSTPAPAGTCTGIVPCYCQNGYCFNNGATLSQSCLPPAGQTCTPTTVNPSAIGIQYAYGYGSSVNVCKCTTSGGK